MLAPRSGSDDLRDDRRTANQIPPAATNNANLTSETIPNRVPATPSSNLNESASDNGRSAATAPCKTNMMSPATRTVHQAATTRVRQRVPKELSTSAGRSASEPDGRLQIAITKNTAPARSSSPLKLIHRATPSSTCSSRPLPPSPNNSSSPIPSDCTPGAPRCQTNAPSIT